MSTRIGDVMTASPKCLDSRIDVREAAMLMAFEGIGDVIVCDGDEIFGIVTDRDITVRCVAQGRDPSMTPLSEIASTDLAWLSPDDTEDDAVRIMRERALRRLPVVQNNRPVGVVSLGDLAIDLDRQSALADISAAPPST